MLAKPVAAQWPIIGIGRAGQTLEWIAAHADGWRPYGYGTWFDLDADPLAPPSQGRALRGGWRAIVDHLTRQEDVGVSHVILNLAQAQRPAEAVVREPAEHVLPRFAPRSP